MLILKCDQQPTPCAMQCNPLSECCWNFVQTDRQEVGTVNWHSKAVSMIAYDRVHCIYEFGYFRLNWWIHSLSLSRLFHFVTSEGESPPENIKQEALFFWFNVATECSAFYRIATVFRSRVIAVCIGQAVWTVFHHRPYSLTIARALRSHRFPVFWHIWCWCDHSRV